VSGKDTVKTGSLLSLSERERKELLAEVDRKIAEIDENQGTPQRDASTSEQHARQP